MYDSITGVAHDLQFNLIAFKNQTLFSVVVILIED